MPQPLPVLPELEIFQQGYRSVISVHTSEHWQPRPEIAQQVERVWKQYSRTDGWNSVKIRLEGSRVEGGVLYVTTALTDWKHHIATRYQPNPADRAMLLGTGAIITTSDGFYVFGQRSRDHKYNLISGGVDPEYDIEIADDIPRLLFNKALYREMHEEIGILLEDIESIEHCMLCSVPGDGAHNLVYRVRLGISRQILDQRVVSAIAAAHKECQEPEIIAAKYIPCSRNALFEELQSHKDDSRSIALGILQYLYRNTNRLQ